MVLSAQPTGPTGPSHKWTRKRITLNNFIVDGPARTLTFYNAVLGSHKHHDVPDQQRSGLAAARGEQPDGTQQRRESLRRGRKPLPGRCRSLSLVAAAVVLLAMNCSAGGEGPSSPPADTTDTNGEPSTTSDAPADAAPAEPAGGEIDERDCSPHFPGDLRLDTTSLTTTSFKVSQTFYECANEVGLAPATNPAALATLRTRGIDGPLLVPGSLFSRTLRAELLRLDPKRIVTAGFTERAVAAALTEYDYETVEVDPQAVFNDARATHDRVWLVDSYLHAVPLAFVGDELGARVVTFFPDLSGVSDADSRLIRTAAQVDLLSDFSADGARRLEVLRRGHELPGGGAVLFEPARGRRLIAIYGNPLTSSLGVLGEQGPEAAIERLELIAQGYEADGSEILPTFEIIATVAAGSAGADGNYSNETPRDVIRPWIEAAAANDVYVVLDLQPGRSDFLSQAKIYEEFLRLPHVGLALDPEWRLKPHQVHLNQIGTVDGAEINQVVDWLAGIVREEQLPQKLLILHQFRFSMITNRNIVKTPAELAVLVHMDGQGPLATKYATWNALTGQPDADRFYWGWKNFYDEDSPLATPAQVLELAPRVDFVSFQ